jgi:GNAT superfamily N-acetyltransferase
MTPITLTPYRRSAQRELMQLIDYQSRLHIHLDWTTPDEWVNDPNTCFRLAWQADQLVGALAISPPIEGSAWIRLAAVFDDVDPAQIFNALLESVRPEIKSVGVRELGVLIVQNWLEPLLPANGFHPYEKVVTLQRENQVIPSPLRTDLQIVRGELTHLQDAIRVDHAAFLPIWRMPADSLRMAIRGAHSFTLARLAGRTVGYQISMRYGDTGHLARLATLPDLQGKGIGGALLGEMLTSLQKRGLSRITVNTQATNQQSIHLYQRYGFELSGLDHPVWLRPI